MNPDAVLFDFDGTLVDTLPLHYEAYRLTFVEYAVEVSYQRFLKACAGTGRDTVAMLMGCDPSDPIVSEIHGKKIARVAKIFSEDAVTVLATSQILAALVGRKPLGLASSGSRRGIDILLGRLGWKGWFDCIVTGDDVSRGKPDPEIYLTAALRLRVAPDCCLTFEDTPEGIASARAAGCAVIDVRCALNSPL